MQANNNNNAQEITSVVNHELPNGDIYSGKMIKGVPNGQGYAIRYADSRERTKDGDFIGEHPMIRVTCYEGNFECGRLVGHGREIKSDGTVLEGNFRAGEKLGNFLTTDSSGVVSKQLYYCDRLAKSTTGNLLHAENVPNSQDHFAAIELIKQQNQGFQR